jgi:hypothetical protein
MRFPSRTLYCVLTAMSSATAHTISNVYIPRLLLDLSAAPLSFLSLARFVPVFAKRRCFRERHERQVFSCLSADKSEDVPCQKDL